MSLVKISTQNSFEFLVTLGQCFFLFPVTNGGRKSYFIVKFDWLSLKTIAAVVFMGFSLIEAVFFLIYILGQEKKLPSSCGLAFFLTVLIYKILFINIARKWPNLMRKWNEVDFYMQNYTILKDYRVKMKIVVWASFIFALVEHFFFMLSSGLFIHKELLKKDLDTYFSKEFQFVFIVLPYNIYLGVFIQILNWLWTLIWNYADVFLILISIPLSFRMAQIENKVMAMVKYKVTHVMDWKYIREDYVRITELCCDLEDCVSPLIIVSFANKLYVVMYQLMELIVSTRKDGTASSCPTLIDRSYFAFSFVYLLIKLVSVTLFASTVYEKSKDIVSHLFSVSSEAYNTEVERFITCINISPPVITGSRMFEMKKSLLLKIASSIIMYELVLLKFEEF